jgi:hypothetical protein
MKKLEKLQARIASAISTRTEWKQDLRVFRANGKIALGMKDDSGSNVLRSKNLQPISKLEKLRTLAERETINGWAD